MLHRLLTETEQDVRLIAQLLRVPIGSTDEERDTLHRVKLPLLIVRFPLSSRPLLASLIHHNA